MNTAPWMDGNMQSYQVSFLHPWCTPFVDHDNVISTAVGYRAWIRIGTKHTSLCCAKLGSAAYVDSLSGPASKQRVVQVQGQRRHGKSGSSEW